MTLKELQATAKARTGAVLGAWTERPTGQTKKLLTAYQQAYKTIEPDLKDAYAKFLTGVNPDDYYNEMTKFNRLSDLNKQVVKAYNAAARKAGIAQIEISKTALANEYYQRMFALNWFSGVKDNSFYKILDPTIVEVSVYGTPKIWGDLSKKDKGVMGPYLPKQGTVIDNLRANRQKDLVKLNQTITRNLRQGKSYTKMAAEIKGVLNTSISNAVRIARTEGMRNMNSGAYANTQAAIDSGIDIGREVVETTDGTTRSQSAAINGQKQEGNDPFRYPSGLLVDIIGNSGVAAYDINERGTSVDYLADMEPNTVEGINPATGKHGKADMKEFDSWMKDNDLKYNASGRITSKGSTAF